MKERRGGGGGGGGACQRCACMQDCCCRAGADAATQARTHARTCSGDILPCLRGGCGSRRQGEGRARVVRGRSRGNCTRMRSCDAWRNCHPSRECCAVVQPPSSIVFPPCTSTTHHHVHCHLHHVWIHLVRRRVRTGSGLRGGGTSRRSPACAWIAVAPTTRDGELQAVGVTTGAHKPSLQHRLSSTALHRRVTMRPRVSDTPSSNPRVDCYYT
jgi:hypothetical protein